MPEQRRAALQSLLGKVPGVGITGIEYNSTLIRPGDLSVAIPGDRFDGHDDVADAIEHGAVAVMVMVERPVSR